MPTTEEKGAEILRMAEAWQQDWASEHDDPTGLCERASVHLIPRLLDALTRSQEEVERLRGLVVELDSQMTWMLHRRRVLWDDNEISELSGRARRALEEERALNQQKTHSEPQP